MSDEKTPAENLVDKLTTDDIKAVTEAMQARAEREKTPEEQAKDAAEAQANKRRKYSNMNDNAFSNDVREEHGFDPLA